MAINYQFNLSGRVIPYTRMTRRGKWKSARAQEYIASQTAIGLQVRQQMALNEWGMLPDKTPLKLEVAAIVPDRLYTMDVDNIGKAAQDALQHIVFKNDCWIVETRFTKVLGKDYQTLIWVGTAV